MQPGAQRLALEHEARALRYLAGAPYDNVFLTWLIERERTSNVKSALYVYIAPGNEVGGVAFFGRQVVIAAQDDAAIAAFAEVAPIYRFERMIVGPRAAVESYWTIVKRWHAPPRAVRSSQPVLRVDASSLRPVKNGVVVRRARPDEWQTVANNSADMIRQELEYDPQTSAEFNAGVRIMIERGLWWVGEHAGRHVFFCNAGPYSKETLQLQGIWTPPGDRGRGYATRALAGVCAQLLDDVPTISLYVNAFNTEALALYARVGFEQVGEFATLLF